MTTVPSLRAKPLRQLQWAPLPADYLIEECHGLVNMDVKNTNPERKAIKVEERAIVPIGINNKERPNLWKSTSPYCQQLGRPKASTLSLGSPAQRAAKNILKIQERLLRLDGKWSQDIHSNKSVATTQLLLPVDKAGTHAQLNTTELSLATAIVETIKVSPIRTNTLEGSLKRKKKRPLTHEERQHTEKLERLAAWLKGNPETDEFENTGHKFTREDTRGDISSLCSVEVKARIQSAVQCQSLRDPRVGLWDDPVRSLLAAEMTSESVFGGIVPTQVLAFQPNHHFLWNAEKTIVSTAPDQIVSENPGVIADLTAKEAQLSRHAHQIPGAAYNQAPIGAVKGPLAILKLGDHEPLCTSRSHRLRFNYSVRVHICVTRIQLYYRARQRHRIYCLLLLQRQWRQWNRRRQMLKSLQIANKQASSIQRRYKLWYAHVTLVRSAVRIQRYFRRIPHQMNISRFQQACRMLLARHTLRRRIKTRLRVIGRLALLSGRRRRNIITVQSLWRRRYAQAHFTTLLAHASTVELVRRAQEDAYVAENLHEARAHFREFLAVTELGRRQVRWQDKKPWLRFRRVRADAKLWDELPMFVKVDIVARMLSPCSVQGLDKRALCQMLVGKGKQLPTLPKTVELSVEALQFLATVASILKTRQVQKNSGSSSLSTVVRKKVKGIPEWLSRRLPMLWWTLATYPKEYYAAQMCHSRTRRQVLASQQLEIDFVRIITVFLRAKFRLLDRKTNTPRYVCEWCFEPFGTLRTYCMHNKCAAARARAEMEWAALRSDLQFARRNKWRFLTQFYDVSVRTYKYANEPEAASVDRLRSSHKHWDVLRPPVASLTVSSGNDRLNDVVQLDYLAFVLQYLDRNAPLVQVVEQLWSNFFKAIGLGSSGRGGCWIRKDDLHLRLFVEKKWKRVLSWWHGNFDYLRQKDRAAPIQDGFRLKVKKVFSGKRAGMKGKEPKRWVRCILLKRTGTAQRTPTVKSTAAAGTRIVSGAT